MKATNQIVSRIESQIRQGEPQTESMIWSKEAEKLCLLLFVRLSDLFGNRARACGLEIEQAPGVYTKTFKTWCYKLRDLTRDDIAYGVKRIEMHIADGIRCDREVWPPSYAEMIGYCKREKKPEYWQRLPPPQMTNEERKISMAELRKKMRI